MINILENFKKTPVANARFKIYYEANNWKLRVPIKQFLKTDFRYQLGVFLDYLRKENIGINIALNGYVLYIIDNSLVDSEELAQDWIYTVTDDNLYIIDARDVKHPKHITEPDIQMQEVHKEAIIRCFDMINIAKRGWSNVFDDYLNGKG